ncbi:hypothetical protein A2V56_02670 [Candidatus Woesebacteria bacterium RBG_19FT_COMBO_42_9]|nr:MAG: hypothetical protein A2V56_02670 [Candidatus Woesebacteria bacterium RBG_19FT_COMBO_42_9]
MIKNNKKTYILLFLILIISIAFRFYKLSEVPLGMLPDAFSQAYNAFSILHTGKDLYGENFPILFRAFGSYQPPLYTYLTVIPIMLFGNTIFSARFVSAFSGVLGVVLTYLIISNLFRLKKDNRIGLLASLMLAISPWAIYFSHRPVEANLALTVFLLGYFLLLKSLNNIRFFPFAAIVMGFSTHAYYSERIIGLLFFLFFILWYRKILWRSKRLVLLGIVLFFIIQIPHLIILFSGAFSRRLDQVGYIKEGGNVIKTFLNQFLIYLSPKYLFSDAGESLGRLIPEMGPFFSWLFIPFLLGLKFLSTLRDKSLSVQLVFLGAISLIPASLTGDLFYPLRTLEFLWIVTIVISLGIYYLVARANKTVLIILVFLTSYSLFTFFTSYFVLFKFESAKYYTYQYIKLLDYLDKYRDRQIVIDTGRDTAGGLRIAYFWKIDPAIIQKQMRSQLQTSYYSGVVNANEEYRIGNVEVRPIIWGKDGCSPNSILVGDSLAISPEQVTIHNLSLEFEVQDVDYNPALFGYSTNPPTDCKTRK